MSEFITPKEFQDFKDSVAEFHATTRESFIGIEFKVNKIMTNELVHLQSDIKELKSSFKELNKSILPFIEKVNNTLSNFEKQDEEVRVKLKDFNSFMEEQKKNSYKLIGAIGVLMFIMTFFAGEIKGLFQ